MKQEIIVFGGGCFWCTEAVFQRIRGVLSVIPGYAGGDIPDPTYEQVIGEQTNHAEVIEVRYDPTVVAFDDLLSVFFATHDPTSVNRQGYDVGRRYRSVIFTTTPEQMEEARQYIDKLNASTTLGKPIVTEVIMLDRFYPAEKDHINFYNNNIGSGYCQYVIEPKLAIARERFAKLMKDQEHDL